MGQAFLHRQLLLVLVPIVALAVFGGLGLRRDRSAVEREARERSMEAMERFADRFVEEWPKAFRGAVAGAAHMQDFEARAIGNGQCKGRVESLFALCREVRGE